MFSLMTYVKKKYVYINEICQQCKTEKRYSAENNQLENWLPFDQWSK